MKIYWNEKIRNIDPYTPGVQPVDRKYIKLNTNENPYGPSPEVFEGIRESLNNTIRLYPNPCGERLKNAIAKKFDVSSNCVFVGNGSDEILAFSFQAFFNSCRQVLFPDVTYSFYKVYAKIFDVAFREIPLDESFRIRVDDYKIQNDGIIIANPNAPTGINLKIDEVEELVSSNQSSVVIIDEAYIDFGGESAVKLIRKYPNLLVVQTFSKSRSLAGLRIGFAIGNPDLIMALETVKNCFNSYTLDRLALIGGECAIRDEAYFERIVKKIVNTRERAKESLLKREFEVLDSKTNFLFITHAKIKAGELFEFLEKNGVLVRYFNKNRIENYLRITVGTDDEMDAMMKVIDKYIEEHMEKHMGKHMEKRIEKNMEKRMEKFIENEVEVRREGTCEYGKTRAMQ